MKTYENFIKKLFNYSFENPKIKETYYSNGQKCYKMWYLNGRKHREDGPAEQWWYIDGQKTYERWFLNNKEYSREDWIDQLKNIESDHYEEQLLLYNMEKYNL